jgi:Na+(H+)/acetate symporter ActP
MNLCIKLALAGMISVSLLGYGFTNSVAYHLYFAQMPIWKFLIALAGWSVATYGPIVVATVFWKTAKRTSASWLFHTFLLPSLYALLISGNALMLSTLDVPDFDDTLGAPIMPALFIIIATMIVYLSALVLNRATTLRTRSNGS